ncbi:hypothetical protein ACFE04_021169 [Oxalis oulophora]
MGEWLTAGTTTTTIVGTKEYVKNIWQPKQKKDEDVVALPKFSDKEEQIMGSNVGTMHHMELSSELVSLVMKEVSNGHVSKEGGYSVVGKKKTLMVESRAWFNKYVERCND